MKLFQGIDDLTKKSSILVLLDIFLLILPGTAVIYVVNPGLIVSLDWFKLMMISATITAPFVLTNSLAFAILDNLENENGDDGEDDTEFFDNFTFATFITGIFVYAFLGVHYFFNVPIKYLIVIGIVIEVVVALYTNWRIQKNSKEKVIK